VALVMNDAGEASQAAPSTPKTDDQPKPKQPRGTVTVLVERCKACGNCVIFCPKDVLEMSDEFNERGYHYPCVTKPEECTGCRLCELLCGEFAVFVQLNKPAKSKEQP
jgi:2-oxoglutarate ferredoxin oxidoreductase subunit delta